MIKKGLVVTLVGLLCSCASTSTGDNLRKAQAHYELGIAKMQEGQYQQAFVEFQKAKTLNPEDKRIYYALGLVYQQFGQFNEAEDSFKKAVKIDKEYSEAYNSLGLLYTKMKRYREAENAFNKALSNPLYLNPERALTNLGMLYYRENRFREAEEQFKNALRRSPEFFPAFYGLALTYRAMGRYSDSAEALAEAIRLDPAIQGDREKAFEYFNRHKMLVEGQDEKADYEAFIEILYY